MKRKSFLCLLLMALLLVACHGGNKDSTPDENAPHRSNKTFSVGGYHSDTLKIVAGSENKMLEPVIESFAKKNKVNIQIDYLGSLDIMALLQFGELDYDAVWPASSIWLTLGDKHRLLKHTETTSITPVVFGIKRALAEELGFVGRDVTTSEIIRSIESGKLKFCMTSATQSNSGASAYLGFLSALSSSKDGLTSQDLADPALQNQITSLLKGVERSSGSSNWLMDLFLTGDYDAMVNYETLIIQTNERLEKEGKEPLYCVYPVDGLSLSDSPLAYVDKGDAEKEKLFLDFQKYILSDKAQDGIEKTGKRSAYGTVREENKKIYKKEWGIDLDRVLSSVRLPKADVIMEALKLYQGQFKKPALTVYVLDYSGSMYGKGEAQMNRALEQVLIPENAAKNLLLGTDKDKTVLVPFSDSVYGFDSADGNGDALKALYEKSQGYEIGGGTSMYEAIIYALDHLKKEGLAIENYSPAVVVLTDGMANGMATIDDLQVAYDALGEDVPIFGILFGAADPEELDQVAKLSRARVFDGRENLVEAFQQVKGYN